MSNSKCSRDARRLSTIAVAALTGLALSAPSRALVINPTFNGLSADAQAQINLAIDFYEKTFSDPITVDIEFHNMSTGLGRSDYHYYFWSYDSYRAALIADKTSPNDTIAVATVPAGPNDPILGKQFITLKSATGRAVGLPTPGLPTVIDGICNFIGDGCVGINVSLATTLHGATGVFEVAEHEINEVLGLGSSLQSDGKITQGFISPEDLFRYNGVGVRSFTFDCGFFDDTARAFLSLDGGNTNLNEFNNCLNDGDFGDWITHTPTQIQDAFDSPGSPFLTMDDTAVIALDAVGYTFIEPAALVSEPMGVLLLGTGFLGLGGVRRRGARMAPYQPTS